MAIPPALAGRLRLPVIQSPMFLASSPELVAACCRAGVLGSFPALNARTTDALRDRIQSLRDTLGPDDAPFGVNLVVHGSNTRLQADLDVICAERVPLVITSLGAVRDVVERVQAHGGLVFHDVINRRFAEKAADAGVDGIIAVAAGAGGHAGGISPFALMAEIARVCKPGGRVIITNHFQRDTGFLSRVERLAAPLSSLLGWPSDFAMDRVLQEDRLSVEQTRRLPPMGMMTLLELSKA